MPRKKRMHYSKYRIFRGLSVGMKERERAGFDTIVLWGGGYQPQ